MRRLGETVKKLKAYNNMGFNPSVVMLREAKHLRIRDMKKILHYAMLRSE